MTAFTALAPTRELSADEHSLWELRHELLVMSTKFSQLAHASREIPCTAQCVAGALTQTCEDMDDLMDWTH